MSRAKKDQPEQIEQVAVDSLIPYARNAKLHPPEQVAKIAGSIREFGFIAPVIIDAANNIIAGHGRVLAAQKLGLESVPCRRVDNLTETQRKAYILADNKLSESGWDFELLNLELDELAGLDFDIESIGFDLPEIGEGGGDDEKYTKKLAIPIYEPTAERPSLSECIDTSKAEEYSERIKQAGLDSETESFLLTAAQRLTVFNYAKIAELYAHEERPEVQELMESLALVIIDFDSAIENGYVHLTERLKAAIGMSDELD